MPAARDTMVQNLLRCTGLSEIVRRGAWSGRMADPNLRLLLETPVDFASRIENWLRTAPPGRTGIRQAARAFGRSPRSFQRELADLGLTFADIRDAARCSVAKQMLAQTTSSITDIALEIGYSELSAFSRSFKRQVGLGPSRYRAALLDRSDTIGGRAPP